MFRLLNIYSRCNTNTRVYCLRRTNSRNSTNIYERCTTITRNVLVTVSTLLSTPPPRSGRDRFRRVDLYVFTAIFVQLYQLARRPKSDSNTDYSITTSDRVFFGSRRVYRLVLIFFQRAATRRAYCTFVCDSVFFSS